MSVEEHFEVCATETFENQARETMWYLFDVSGGSKAPKSFLIELERAKGRLAELPFLGRMARSGSLSRRGYRVLAMRTHAIVYVADGRRRRVTLYGVFHQRREYEALL